MDVETDDDPGDIGMTENGRKERNWYYIREWYEGNFTFTGAWCYEDGNRGILVDSMHGGTMILEHRLLKSMAEGRAGDDLRFKLIARGFAKIDGSREIASQDMCPPRPAFFMLDLTSKCNFKCRYCLREIEGNNESITWEQLDKTLDFLIAYAREYHLPGMTIQPWGGEPMIEFEKILHIRKRFDDEEIPLCMTMETNGSLMTEEAAEKLKQARVKVGISIDGYPAIHNYYRRLRGGQESFEDVWRGIQNLKKAGFTRIGGIGVVTRKTLEHLEDVLDFYVNVLGSDGFKLSIMHSPADSELCADMLDEHEIQQYAERLIEQLCVYYRSGKRVLESSISNRMANLIYRCNQNICVSNGCRGGRRLLSVDKYGDIYLCELMDMPDQRIGNVSDGRTIPEMVEQAISGKEYFREKKEEKCETCPWWYYCGGGCTGIVLYEKGCVEGVDPVSCAFNRAAYQKLAEIMLSDPELALKFI